MVGLKKTKDHAEPTEVVCKFDISPCRVTKSQKKRQKRAEIRRASESPEVDSGAHNLPAPSSGA